MITSPHIIFCIQNLYQIKEKALKWCRYGCNYYRGVASGFVGTGYIPGDNCGELQDLALELRDPTQVGRDVSRADPAAALQLDFFFLAGIQLTKYTPTITIMKAAPLCISDDLSVLSFSSLASLGARAPRIMISITVRMGWRAPTLDTRVTDPIA